MENYVQNVNNVEWYEGNDPEFDFNELNKAANINRYTNPNNNNIDYSDIKPGLVYEKLNAELATIKIVGLNKTGSTEASIDENPILKFNKIKSEIDLIEKDLEFYSKNKEAFDGKCSLKKSFSELKNLKVFSDFIKSSDNYKILKELKDSHPDLQKENYKLLNYAIYEKLNEHIINKMEIVNKLKTEGIKKYEDVQYQLYMTPDTMKVKLFSKMIEIKKAIQNIEAKIGSWDIKSKKQSIAEVVNNIKNNLRLFDKEYQKELQNKMEMLNNRLQELNEGKEEFYQTLSKETIDQLYKILSDSKEIEDFILKTISKMESLQNNHEQSAFIFLKLREVKEQQDKIESSMEENSQILKNLKENISTNTQIMKKNLDLIKDRLKNIIK